MFVRTEDTILDGMGFVYGAILWGGLAVAAPVAIHLLLRPRPRREPLPTLRFLRKLQRRHFARIRWKHILLLLLRTAAVLLIVLLLSRMFLTDTAGAVASAPTATVVVLDTSASMGYRRQGRTVLRQGGQIAADIVESLPPGSSAAVLSTSPKSAGGVLLPDGKLVAQQIRDALPGQDDAPLAPTLASALRILRDRPEPSRDLLIVTDSTKQAWRGMEPFSPEADIRVRIIDVGVQRAANVALAPPRLEADTIPRDTEVPVRTVLSSEHLTGAMQMELWSNDRILQRRSVDLQAGAGVPVTFQLQADSPGVLLGRMNLRNEDPLQADNVRYFTVDVSPPAMVLLVSPRGANPTAFLLGNAVAPPMPGRTGALQRRTIQPNQLTAEALQSASMVILADAPTLTPNQWNALEQYCRQGHGLWIVPGESLQPASYDSQEARQILPAGLGRLETLPGPMTFSPPDTNQPLLRPFAPGPDTNPPLRDVRVDRRFAVESVAADAEVVLRYADGPPAILQRRVGEGRVILWNVSPRREWSNLARLGGQFVILAQRTAWLLLGAAEQSRQFTPDEMIALPLPREFHHPNATLQRQGDAHQTPVTFALTQTPRRYIRLAPRDVGNYTLTLREAERTRPLGFSVNTPAGESNLTRLPRDELDAMFPAGVTLGDPLDRSARDGTVLRRLDLTGPLFLLLLAILVSEAFFANRFHRQAKPAEEEYARSGSNHNH